MLAFAWLCGLGQMTANPVRALLKHFHESVGEDQRGYCARDAINAVGVYVPQLCKDPDQKARGACRTCLVQIDGMRGFPAPCTTPCTEGMKISVDSPEAQRIRRGVIELTMAMHPDACQTNRPNTHNDVVDAAQAHAITAPKWAPLPDPSVDTSNPFFVLDMQQCILCARCVTACDEVQHIGAISPLGRGSQMKVGTYEDQPLRESICTSRAWCAPTMSRRTIRASACCASRDASASSSSSIAIG